MVLVKRKPSNLHHWKWLTETIKSSIELLELQKWLNCPNFTASFSGTVDQRSEDDVESYSSALNNSPSSLCNSKAILTYQLIDQDRFLSHLWSGVCWLWALQLSHYWTQERTVLETGVELQEVKENWSWFRSCPLYYQYRLENKKTGWASAVKFKLDEWKTHLEM